MDPDWPRVRDILAEMDRRYEQRFAASERALELAQSNRAGHSASVLAWFAVGASTVGIILAIVLPLVVK